MHDSHGLFHCEYFESDGRTEKEKRVETVSGGSIQGTYILAFEAKSCYAVTVRQEVVRSSSPPLSCLSPWRVDYNV